MCAIPVKVKALAKDRQLPMQNEKERDGEHTGLLGRASEQAKQPEKMRPLRYLGLERLAVIVSSLQVS
jgi:hypothetical protein